MRVGQATPVFKRLTPPPQTRRPPLALSRKGRGNSLPQIVLKFIWNDRRWVFNPILFRSPGTQINQLAAFTAKGPKLVGFNPLYGLFAVGAVNCVRLIAMFLHDAAWLAPNSADVAAQPVDRDG